MVQSQSQFRAARVSFAAVRNRVQSAMTALATAAMVAITGPASAQTPSVDGDPVVLVEGNLRVTITDLPVHPPGTITDVAYSSPWVYAALRPADAPRAPASVVRIREDGGDWETVIDPSSGEPATTAGDLVARGSTLLLQRAAASAMECSTYRTLDHSAATFPGCDPPVLDGSGLVLVGVDPQDPDDRQVWDIATASPVRTLRAGDFLESGRIYARDGDCCLSVTDARTGERAEPLAVPDTCRRSLAAWSLRSVTPGRAHVGCKNGVTMGIPLDGLDRSASTEVERGWGAPQNGFSLWQTGGSLYLDNNDKGSAVVQRSDAAEQDAQGSPRVAFRRGSAIKVAHLEITAPPRDRVAPIVWLASQPQVRGRSSIKPHLGFAWSLQERYLLPTGSFLEYGTSTYATADGPFASEPASALRTAREQTDGVVEVPDPGSAAGSGPRGVCLHARGVDLEGNTSAWERVCTFLDAEAPVVRWTDPQREIDTRGLKGPVELRWRARDDDVISAQIVDRFSIYPLDDQWQFTDVARPRPTANRLRVSLVPGTTACLRVRAFDRGGNVGAPPPGQGGSATLPVRCISTPADDRDLSFTGAGPRQTAAAGALRRTVSTIGFRTKVVVRGVDATGIQIVTVGRPTACPTVKIGRTRVAVRCTTAVDQDGRPVLRLTWKGRRSTAFVLQMPKGEQLTIDALAVVSRLSAVHLAAVVQFDPKVQP